VFATLSYAGPFGIFGGRMSGGGCANGSCGSSAMSSSWGSSSLSWGAAPTKHPAAESIEVASVRTLDFYVNAERARAGLPPVKVSLAMNAELQTALEIKANAGVFEHTALPYKENIARGGSGAAAVVKAWMADPKLAANILSPDYRTCGYARAIGSDGKTYWALAMGK
jgi:uncharacterized protein YkwD